jgi:hypothetical protein
MQSELDNITMVPTDKHCAFLCENCDRPPVNPDEALPPTEPERARSALAASLRPDQPVSVPATRPTLVPSEDDLDECEILLRRAIEMVRGSTRWSQPTRSLTDRMSGRSLSSRVVQIHHDPGDATYVATDAKSGLCVLRHRDRARCARCVIGLDGRWLRSIPQRGRLNAADRGADATLVRFEMEPHCGANWLV